VKTVVGTMVAALMAERPASLLRIAELERPEALQDDDALVSVEACGVCGTDLHIMAGEAYQPELPFVLGHEVVGRVVGPIESSGPSGPRGPEHQLVAVWPFLGCGNCRLCALGEGQLCPAQASVTGVSGAFGGFAEYVLVKRDQLVPVPEGLRTSAAAAVVDAGTTALNAVEAVPAGTTGLHVIVGAGPVGFCVAELLRARGVAPVVVERAAKRRLFADGRGFAVAPELGAVTEEPAVVIDCGGRGEALAWAVGALGPHGLVVVVAYGVIDRFDTTQISRKEITVKGVRSGTRDQLGRALRIAASGAMGGFQVREWELTDVNKALEAARAGDPAKQVVVTRAERAMP
jgi:D-arabinose 1-dehydrogenase-like Zn-dependent alcohol dehydrogenase